MRLCEGVALRLQAWLAVRVTGQSRRGRGASGPADLCPFPDFFPPLDRNVTVPVWGPTAVTESTCKGLYTL